MTGPDRTGPDLTTCHRLSCPWKDQTHLVRTRMHALDISYRYSSPAASIASISAPAACFAVREKLPKAEFVCHSA